MLFLDDLQFPITKAEFGGILYEHSNDEQSIKWRFDLETEKKIVKTEEYEENWKPHLESLSLDIVLPHPHKLTRYKVIVPPHDEKEEEPPFILYIFEHESVYDVKMTFGERQGNLYDFLLEGFADVYWDDKYGARVPLRVETQIAFEGITMLPSKDYPEGNEARARETLSQFFDEKEWVAGRSPVGNLRFQLFEEM
jgi:hypothetical protein